MYTFAELPGGLELYMTDNPWNETEVVPDTPEKDGTVMVSGKKLYCFGKCVTTPLALYQ